VDAAVASRDVFPDPIGRGVPICDAERDPDCEPIGRGVPICDAESDPEYDPIGRGEPICCGDSGFCTELIDTVFPISGVGISFREKVSTVPSDGLATCAMIGVPGGCGVAAGFGVLEASGVPGGWGVVAVLGVFEAWGVVESWGVFEAWGVVAALGVFEAWGVVAVLGVFEDWGVTPERLRIGRACCCTVGTERVPLDLVSSSDTVAQPVEAGGALLIVSAPASPPEQSGQRAGPTSMRGAVGMGRFRWDVQS
jgi:hypothetical protein